MDEIDVEAVDRVDSDTDTDTGSANGHDNDVNTTGQSIDDGPADIEVTPTVTDLPQGVDAPEYVLYGGKGGVGKTTMAAATALSSAAGGISTLVVSTDPAHSLSDTLGVQIPPRPTQIREDMPLYAAEIDPDAAVEDGMFGAGGDPLGGMGDLGEQMGPMGEMFGGEDGDDPLGGMGEMLGGSSNMPGADEAAAMRQLLEYLDDPRFDRVVIDTAPTGHTLRLLQLPELMDSMVGRMLKLRQQFKGMMGSIKGMFGGADGADPMAEMDELRDRIERLRAVLRDPEQTDFRVVMIPEEMSIVESERLVSRLAEFEIPVQTLVINRVMENLTDVTDAEIDPSWVVTPNLEACEFCQRRWTVQQNSLRRATELFRGREVKRVPLLADEVRGEDALRIVAACLD